MSYFHLDTSFNLPLVKSPKIQAVPLEVPLPSSLHLPPITIQKKLEETSQIKIPKKSRKMKGIFFEFPVLQI